jgi:hypothetical protein
MSIPTEGIDHGRWDSSAAQLSFRGHDLIKLQDARGANAVIEPPAEVGAMLTSNIIGQLVGIIPVGINPPNRVD